MHRTEISFSLIAAPSGVEVIRGNDVAHSFPAHRHGVLCIGLLEKGKRLISTKVSDHTVSAGDVFIINPGEVHACSSTDERPHSYRMLCVDEAALNQVSRDFQVRFNQLKISDRELFGRLQDLCDALVSGDAGYIKQSVFKSTMTDLICNYGECSSLHERTERAAIKIAREFLDDNVTRDVHIADLASACGLSPFHLTRCFRKQIGITPHVYQMHGRIKRAKNLLTKGIPIAEVALESGFHDQSHFTNVFKRVMGITPFRYSVTLK